MISQERGSRQNAGLGWGGSRGQEGTFKKIQNYIFNFNDQLGQGNFSKVYKGHNEVTGDIVAIKIVELNSLKSKKLQELLFSQIQILKKLNHPNILRCFQVFTSNRNCYIITQLCNEGDLQSKLKKKKAMKEEEAASYIKAVFKGLMYLSDHGIVHRDIKVSNIFIHDGEAKIADFGFAKATRSKFKDINIGSPIYMSPEGLIDNIYGPKTDIWAFGVLIFELLHGQTPYSHCKSENDLKYSLSIPIGWSQLKADLSTDVKEVILKCLEIQQPNRFSATQLANLAYFSKMNNQTQFRDRKEHQSAISPKNYQWVNQLQPFVFKSDSEHMFQQEKYRIKTDNDGYLRKINRELSTGMSFKKAQEQNFPFKPPTKTSQNLKVMLEDERNKIHKKHTSSSTNFTGGYELNMMGYNKSNLTKKTNSILSAQITFRQCVNILHYCRLLFKHLVLMGEIGFGDENQRSIFKRWLSTMLKALKNEIDEKKVICEGENAAARERKLDEVTSEYIKKYSQELNLDLGRLKLEESSIINYEKVCSYFTSVQQLIDQLLAKDTVNPALVHLGHSMVLIVHTSKVLRRCYQEHNYSWADKLKEIQEFLSVKKDHLDYNSYLLYKMNYL